MVITTVFHNHGLAFSPIDDVNAIAKHTCSQSSADGAIDLTVSDVYGPYEVTYYNANMAELYKSTFTTNGTTEDLKNVLPGIYKVKVVNSNCGISEFEIEIQSKPPIKIEGDITPICNPGGLGEIIANVTGGSEIYTFEWSTGSYEESIQGLSAGTYTLTVTDSEGCSGVESFEIKPAPEAPLITEFETTKSCSPGQGTITPTVSGGTTPYTFLWSTGATTQDISSLSPGTYSVTVTDSGGCREVESVEVKEIKQEWVKVIEQKMESSCDQGVSDGQIEVVYHGPSEYSVSYLWNTGATTNKIENLGDGGYVLNYNIGGCNFGPVNFQICSCHGCYEDIGGGQEVYTQGSCQEINITLNSIVHRASSTASNDGLIELYWKGVPEGYHAVINWSGPNGFTSDKKIIENLSPGLYNVEIKIGCETLNASFMVGICTEPTYKKQISKPCASNSNGSISINEVQYGDLIKWDHLQNSIPSTRGFFLQGLPSGTYCFTIKNVFSNCSTGLNPAVIRLL